MLVLDEREASVQGMIDAAKSRWPSVPLEQIELPCPEPGITIELREIPREAYNPNGEMAIYPRITLAQVRRDVAGHFGEENLGRIRGCWFNGRLSFNFMKT